MTARRSPMGMVRRAESAGPRDAPWGAIGTRPLAAAVWRCASVWLLVVCVLAIPRVARAGDPYLQWWTLHMPHARLHYDESLEPIARRVADLFEDLHDSMAEELGWSPSQSVEIVLVDSSDSANGSASAFPYNTIRLFVTAPDDMSPLGDHDDWHLELVSHEFTHVLHTDNITGAPAVVNAVLGRTLIPNQAQPRWILEGFAVINESRYSTGGRMRSSMFDMFLRADVLDDRMMGLDQISNSPRRWPQGNVWYLYGSRFLGWIVDTYGYGVLPAIASDTGAQLIPYGLNRSVRRATGATYVELYDAWKAHLRRHYGTQMARVQARGLREGKRLTFEGESAGRPRFVPRAARTSTGTAQVMLHRATSHDPSGFYRLTLDSHTAVRSEELVVRAEGNCSGSFAPDGSFIYSALEPWKRTYFFNDLHRLPSDETAPTGLEPGVQRLTHGHRAHEPDISPDGRHVVYTVNHRGTSYLKIANITPEGGIELPRTLVPSAVFEQAYTPRFSPDGRHVAYSVWTRGGYRDIRIVEVTTGKFRQLMRDRAMDMQPVFSPDGHYLLYVSDRTGIANVYAHDLTSDTLHQVTNVRTGAYQPELSPDGKTLLYVGYTSEGFDLFVMTFEPRTFLQPLPYRAERPARPVEPRHRSYEKRPYNPLPSLRPRALSFRYGPGTFGQALAIETEGRDAVGHHSILLSANIESEQIMPYASASYAYDRLPFRYVSSLFSSLAPRRGYRVNDQELVWLERSLGWSNSFVYGQPRAFDSQTYALTYSIARVDGDLPVGDALDPYAEATSDPLRGNIGVLRAAWSYSNAQRFGYSVGPEYGFTLSAAVDVGNELTASEYSVYALSYRSTAYGRMPWHRHHSVALHLGGGTATGNYPRRGLYYVGGFADTPVHDLINNSVFQGGFVLRGYKPVSFIGSQYHLANVEYRFPIAVVDRGISTLPAYLQRISGNLFIDYGGAFNKLDIENWRDHFHTGIGAEVWVDAQVGYYTLLNVRLGYAKGYGQAAEEGGQKYLVVAAPF